MVINNNITFRRKHRPVWYGMLCLVLITAAVAAVGLLPMQIDDAEPTESGYIYTLSGDGNKTSNNLEEIINLINEPGSGSIFTITMNSNDTIASGLILNEGKKVTLTSSGGPFTLTNTEEYERHFTAVSGTLTLENIILDGNDTVGGIEVQAFGELIMNDGAVIQNCNNIFGCGGGVSVFASGKLIMNDGAEIRNCNAPIAAAGVYIEEGTFIMNGGKISGNTVDEHMSYGGGVYNAGGTFTMNGGEINGNTAGGNYSYGGGVFTDGGTFTMNGGEISGNAATYNGGGVYSGGGVFTMNGGEINGNETEVEGGGVFNLNGTFTMNGGEISGNKAKLGGGVYNNSSGTILITGGEIRDNTATGDDENGSGGGIYAVDFTKLTVKPAEGKEVIFSGNTAPKLRTNDVIEGHTSIYDKNIGEVVLDERVNVGQNAPAYNNYDINYPCDTWVVFIYIEPNGGGTVTVTDKSNGREYSIPDKVGWVYLPTVAGSISLSAAAVGDNEFIRFIKTGTNEVIIPDNVPITGNISVTAEFRLACFITPEADDGSEISPNEVVKVMQGEDKTFTFSAKPEHRITAVYVDGKAISSSDLASGEYTFSNILSNHTIRVESKADDGSGGEGGTSPGNGDITGPGNGNGTGPGNGNGTGPGSDGDKGDVEDGNGNGGENVGSGPSLSENISGEWSILGMICATLAMLTGMIAVVAGKDRFRTDNKEKRSKTSMTLRVMALVIGIISMAAFFLMEDRSLSAAAFGEWTLLMFVLFFAALILTMVSFRFDETDG